MKQHTTIAPRRQTILVAISLLAASSLLLALLWLLGGTPVTAAPAAELHVCPGGPPTCDYATVQAAVDAASPGDVIKVATGVYTGVQAREGITQVVYISKTVALRGGYTTAGWDTPDPEANPTTLDAQGLGRVLVISGAITSTVEGLRITGGDATGLSGGPPGYDVGGGVYVYTATATISGCVIYSNTASTTGFGEGGGLYLWESVGTIQGNAIVSNTASTAGLLGFGGGLYASYSDATIQDNTIAGNTINATMTASGGGLYLAYSTATIQGNTVTDNIANLASSGGDGGGLVLVESTAALQGNVVQGNIASTGGRGSGGGLSISKGTSTLRGNTIRGNVASAADDGHGGGLRSEFGDITLTGNTIVSNTATVSPTAIGRGGGLHVAESNSLTLTNNLVAGNWANTAGSGLCLRKQSNPPTLGRLLHNTIADNIGSGQGVYVGPYTTLAFTNTIIAGHSVGITVTAGSTVTLEGTLWYGNGTDAAGAGTILTGTVNVYDDPAFVNPAAGDYHLGPSSAAIDAGVDAGITEDIDGDPRPQDGGYDIGADESRWKKVHLPLIVHNYDAPEQLLNPGFEGITCRPGSVPPECLDNWTRDTHNGQVYENIFTPQGWVTWWREGGNYSRPEVRVIPNVPPFTGELPRIRSGHYATLLYTFFSLQDMGLYQCVADLEPGATVQFSAHAHGWSCDDSPGSTMGYSCGDPYNQSFQVGIEPDGIADPFAPSIVWNEKNFAPDHYQRIGPVSAQVGEDGKVCVFLRSKTKWMYKYGDAYWDDASLIVTAPAPPPHGPPPPPP